MVHSPMRGFGTAVVLVVVAAGCGSGGDDAAPAAKKATTVDAAFAARAQTACAPYQAYDESHRFPAISLNRYDPDPKVLPQIAEIFAANPRHQSLVADLSALGNPATGSKVWAQVVADITKAEDLAARQIESARSADVGGFADLQSQIEANDVVLHQHLQKSGLPTGSACRVVEADQMQQTGGHG
jgi:hypothetical protein